MLVAYAAFVLVGVNVGVGGVLLPAQVEDYGVDRATIGLTFFTFAAGFMAAGATVGPLVARFGARSILVLSGAEYVLGGLCLAVRPPFWVLVAVQVVLGHGIGALESVLNAYLSRLPSSTTLLNRLHAFFGVGALAGPVLASWLLASGLEWTDVWLVLALLGLPMLALFRAAHPPSTPDALERDVVPDPSDRGLLVAALRLPAVILAAVLLAVYVGLEIGVGNWAFSFLVTDRDAGGQVAGWVVSGYWFGLTLGRFVISPLAGRAGMTPAGMTTMCMVGVVVAAAGVWAVPSEPAAAVGFALLGFFLGPIFPTAMAVVPDLTSARLVPTAIGVMNGVSVVGGAVFPWLAGFLAQDVGGWTLLPFAVALGALQLLCWRLITARMSR